MKKTYIQPAQQVFQISTGHDILSGSNGSSVMGIYNGEPLRAREFNEEFSGSEDGSGIWGQSW